MENCVFCMIASGALPVMKVYEDESTLSFMDNAEDVDGHILVIPKKHVECILDCDAQTLAEVAQAAKKVANHLVDHGGYQGVDILSANGASAGQSLPHFHVHIIPRRYDDGLGGKGEWPRFPGAKRPIGEIFEQIRMI